ncbi:hypothetical protein K431DRAFT_280100 [Polychaeton citri CBS 116435]|uniref:SacI domain-containing protein n=1 Tax=Polychaeton citri CBS 116435 TaxID=1314669 RepID=A0A9P4QJT7_9PEZI|nr:hypothetical protein K431DRAFT_280100 [Polychaeton citri CBS 116435]
MPGLIRKILVFAAADGLILQPLHQRDRAKDGVPLKIAYGTSNPISEAQATSPSNEGKSLEAFGVVGLLDLISTSYIIFITRREQVATIRKSPVYSIKDVTLVPLDSQSAAENALREARDALKLGVDGEAGYESGDTDDGTEVRSSVDEDAASTGEPEALPVASKTGDGGVSIAKDVIQDRGRYGLFAQRWFSRGAWGRGAGKASRAGSSKEIVAGEDKGDDEAAVPDQPDSDRHDGVKSENEAPVTVEEHTPQAQTGTQASRQHSAIEVLTPRIVHNTKLYFSSSSFFFSYDYDLSASLRGQEPPTTTTPLWKRFNEIFFWNRHLLTPFLDAGRSEYALPLLQGFVGQRKFSISATAGDKQDLVAEATTDTTSTIEGEKVGRESSLEPNTKEFVLTLISRRSIRRAGLRYLRRGIDDDGHAANFVETEQLLATDPSDPSHRAFSLVQIRGSIPLFFSQSPYSFKPIPELRGSEALNQQAFTKHFGKLSPFYGSIQCASLVDKHATERGIGEAYERHANLFNENSGGGREKLRFEWFDFHSACKGMKFENVSILMESLQESLKSFGWTEKQQGKTLKQQTGVLRTNCMDCLDRTNVVQSAVAGRALQQQLAELSLHIDLQTDPKTQWFNTLWADNGDAISKQYAGTAALKGDFTRTRKRNWTGALSDFTLTLNRYWTNIFSDYFMQTIIDFQLGNAGPNVFDEFETNMMTQDYAIDMQRVRQNAIETCIKMVLEDPQEDLLGGWTLSCPQQPNTLRSLPFEECVVLLTEAALYFCRFDWDTEKVGSFERVVLTDIQQIWRGTYITSTLGDKNLDESTNVGFALAYAVSGPAMVRRNTRSFQNEELTEDESTGDEQKTQPSQHEKRVLGFKALPPKASITKREGPRASDEVSEMMLIESICGQLQRSLEKAHKKLRGPDHLELGEIPEVEQRDVVSVADAKKSTGYLETLGYSLKKLVWS